MFPRFSLVFPRFSLSFLGVAGPATVFLETRSEAPRVPPSELHQSPRCCGRMAWEVYKAFQGSSNSQLLLLLLLQSTR